MIDCRPTIHLTGLLVAILAVAMVVPAWLDYGRENSQTVAFLAASAICFFLGVSSALANRMENFQLGVREAFFLIPVSWLAVAFFACLPLIFSDYDITWTDAFFESVSGITTTGSTVLVGLDDMSRGVLIWRALLQWLGGIGFIVVAVAALPSLKVGGMQLFRIESSGGSDKIFPRAIHIAGGIFAIYTGLSILCAILLMIAGMTAFDAIAHAMTTIATGGFSTSDESIGYFNLGAVEVTITVFMILGSLPFVLYLQALRGHSIILWRDSQVRCFVAILSLAIMVLSLSIYSQNDVPFIEVLRQVAFNTTSFMTGTGYTTADVRSWGPFGLILLFFLMMVGGCAGSTTCGIKLFRLQILYTVARVQISHMVRPKSIFIPYYNGRPVNDEIARSIMGFFFLFAMSFAILSLALGAIGLDFRSAITAAATALANVGPALGTAFGPLDSFTDLPDIGKWMLAAGMLVGRLEIYTFVVLLTRVFWRP